MYYGIDQSERREVEHGGVVWIFRVMDDTKFSILRDAYQRAALAHLDNTDDPEKRKAAMLGAMELVRWGVVGAKRGDVPVVLPVEREAWCGREHEVVTREAVVRFVRVRDGGLLAWLAGEVLKTNALDEETLLGFQ